MIQRTLSTIVFVAAATLGAVAQTTTTTAPTVAQIVAQRVARLTTLLTLTATQQAQATTYFTTEVTALETIHTSKEAAETTLKTAIQNNDATGIATQATQIGILTTQEVAATATADAAFYLILTSAQQTIYNELKVSGFGGPGGHGGPGGPGDPHH